MQDLGLANIGTSSTWLRKKRNGMNSRGTEITVPLSSKTDFASTIEWEQGTNRSYTMSLVHSWSLTQSHMRLSIEEEMCGVSVTSRTFFRISLKTLRTFGLSANWCSTRHRKSWYTSIKPSRSSLTWRSTLKPAGSWWHSPPKWSGSRPYRTSSTKSWGPFTNINNRLMLWKTMEHLTLIKEYHKQVVARTNHFLQLKSCFKFTQHRVNAEEKQRTLISTSKTKR